MDIKKGQVFDYDLEALMFFNQVTDEPEYYKLENLDVLAGTGQIATATVTMTIGDDDKIVDV